MRDYSLQSLKPSHTHTLSLSRFLILSFEKERALEDRSCSLSLYLGLVKTGRAPRWNVLNQRVHLKKACTVDVGVADPGAGCGSRTGSGWCTGDTEPFRISLTKKVVLSWLHCTCNRKNCHTGQNGCRRLAHKCCSLRSSIKQARCSGKSASGRASIALWRPMKVARLCRPVNSD